MKICIIGLGSIGKRHLKNIKEVLFQKKISNTIDALRSKNSKLDISVSSNLHNIYYNVSDLPNDYDVIFITNPTVFHYNMLMQVIPKTNHVYIEKPVFDRKYYNLENLNLKQDSVYYVACPLRHKSIIQYIYNWLGKGESVFSVRATSSSYLPNWRKGVDYRTNYSANKNMGGGVMLDLIHEWDYITYFFGTPQKVKKFVGKYSGLEIDSEDIAIYIAQYADKLVEVHLDYFGINTERTLELIGEKKRLVADLLKDRIVCYDENKYQEIEFPKEDFYIKEMEYFFRLITEKCENINPLQEATKLLTYIL